MVWTVWLSMAPEAPNPVAAAPGIERGLAAEFAGDLNEAERQLLEAAKLDATYLPRWTLANYYFRRQDWPRFWRWAEAAGRMSHGDSTALLLLCWRVRPDADMILERIVRDEPEPLYWYFHFLIGQREWSAATNVGFRLLDHRRPQDRGEMLAFCDRLLEHGEAAAAVSVWNGLIGRRALPHSPVRMGAVTNAEFRLPPLNSGFDWRVVPAAGVSVGHGGGLRLEFSGRQPERADLLWQWIVVQPGISFRVRGAFDQAAPGLEWRLETIRGELARLVLAYRRQPGATRLEGVVRLTRVALEPAGVLP